MDVVVVVDDLEGGLGAEALENQVADEAALEVGELVEKGKVEEGKGKNPANRKVAAKKGARQNLRKSPEVEAEARRKDQVPFVSCCPGIFRALR